MPPIETVDTWLKLFDAMAPRISFVPAVPMVFFVLVFL